MDRTQRHAMSSWWLRLAATIMLFAGMAVGLAACSGDRPAEGAQALEIYVPKSGGDLEYILPDGTSGTGWEAYQQALVAYFGHNSPGSLEIRVVDMPLFARESGMAFGPEWYKQIPGTQFSVQVDFYGNMPVGDCIGRSGIVVNAKFNNGNDAIINLKFIGYNDGGQSCIGYSSTGSFKPARGCWKDCSPSPNNEQIKSDIEKVINDTAVKIGVAIAVADAIARATTDAIMSSGLAAAF